MERSYIYLIISYLSNYKPIYLLNLSSIAKINITIRYTYIYVFIYWNDIVYFIYYILYIYFTLYIWFATNICIKIIDLSELYGDEVHLHR